MISGSSVKGEDMTGIRVDTPQKGKSKRSFDVMNEELSVVCMTVIKRSI
jgi:hypothetical protein